MGEGVFYYLEGSWECRARGARTRCKNVFPMLFQQAGSEHVLPLAGIGPFAASQVDARKGHLHGLFLISQAVLAGFSYIYFVAPASPVCVG